MADAVNIYIKEEPMYACINNKFKYTVIVDVTPEFMNDKGTREEKMEYIANKIKQEFVKKLI